MICRTSGYSYTIIRYNPPTFQVPLHKYGLKMKEKPQIHTYISPRTNPEGLSYSLLFSPIASTCRTALPHNDRENYPWMRGPQNNIASLPLLIQTLTLVIKKIDFVLLVLEIPIRAWNIHSSDSGLRYELG